MRGHNRQNCRLLNSVCRFGRRKMERREVFFEGEAKKERVTL